MTLPVTARSDAIGNDSTATYPYGFKVFAATHLEVKVKRASDGVITTLTYPTHFTVTNVGRALGGNVVLTSVSGAWQNADGTLKTGYSISAGRVVPLVQETDIRNQGDFFADIHEDAFDYLMMVDQRQQDDIARSVKLDSAYNPADFDMALPAPFAGGVLGWNATATALVNVLQVGASGLVDLASSIGSSLIGFLQSGSGRSSTVEAELQFLLNYNVRAYGWIGDGTTHPLSERYASLAAAQAVYPHAVALTDEIDWAAAQLAINQFSNGRAATGSGAVDFDGVGMINRPLIYGGANGHVIHLRGKTGNAINGTAVGTALKWNGTAGTSMLIMSGANKSTVDGINFAGDGGSGLKYCIHVTADNVVSTTVAASIAVGSVEVTPAAMTNITTGMALTIDAGGPNFEIVYVTAVTGTTFTAPFTKAHAGGAAVGGSSPSSGVEIANLTCAVPAGSDTAGVLFGNATASSTMQVSEFTCRRVQTAGEGSAGDAFAGISVITGGNVKNGLYIDCGFVGFKRGLNIQGGSGTHRVIRPTFANTTVYDILHTAGGQLYVDSLEAESDTGHMMLYGISGGEQRAAVFTGCAWQTAAPADDYFINYSGNLTLIGNEFRNIRTGSSIPKVKIDRLNLATVNAPDTLTSIGNFYENATDFATPFYDSGNSAYGGFELSAAYNQSRLSSIGDYGGTAGGPVSYLSPIINGIANASSGLSVDSTSAGITFNAMAVVSQTYHKVTIPFAAFQAASLTTDLTLFQAVPKTKIVSVYADTTIAFAGTAGTLNLRLGTSTGGQELLVDHDVKTAAVTKGLADADLGASITRAAAIQGGYIPSWTGQTAIKARLTSSSGNLSDLTAGSVTIYVVVERTGR